MKIYALIALATFTSVSLIAYPPSAQWKEFIKSDYYKENIQDEHEAIQDRYNPAWGPLVENSNDKRTNHSYMHEIWTKEQRESYEKNKEDNTAGSPDSFDEYEALSPDTPKLSKELIADIARSNPDNQSRWSSRFYFGKKKTDICAHDKTKVGLESIRIIEKRANKAAYNTALYQIMEQTKGLAAEVAKSFFYTIVAADQRMNKEKLGSMGQSKVMLDLRKQLERAISYGIVLDKSTATSALTLYKRDLGRMVDDVKKLHVTMPKNVLGLIEKSYHTTNKRSAEEELVLTTYNTNYAARLAQYNQEPKKYGYTKEFKEESMPAFFAATYAMIQELQRMAGIEVNKDVLSDAFDEPAYVIGLRKNKNLSL